MIRIAIIFCCTLLSAYSVHKPVADQISVGPRPFFLVEEMAESSLKQKLKACKTQSMARSEFSIAHRGAPLQFPEHGVAGYRAANLMGAAKQECDVTFSRDGELVCRHSQCDLHQTTDVLLRPELAQQCRQPFQPANADREATAQCCTSDFTLEQLLQLCIKMDGYNKQAKTPQEFVQGTPEWRTNLYETCEPIVTHKESIELFSGWGVDMVPELKMPQVSMPFAVNDKLFTQQVYAQKLVDEYIEAQVKPQSVWLQSFDLKDIQYWIKHTPEYATQAIYLDGRYSNPEFNPNNHDTWQPSMKELKAMGLNFIAPPIWMLLTERQGELVPTQYAISARKAGLHIITWTLERSGNMAAGGGWYYQSINHQIKNQGDMYRVLHALAQKVGVAGVFSDWPGTTTYYANCLLPD